MGKPLVIGIAALLCHGCGGSNVSGPDGILPSGQVVQVVVIEGFGDDPGTLTTSKLIRVGKYFDFSSYDSLWISFRATRLTNQLPFDEIRVRIGPSHDMRDSVYTMQKSISLSVRVDDLSKPHFSALTFLATDPRAVLQLSDLRVVGWMTN